MAGRPNLPQFDRVYDQYKMRAMVDDLQRWFRTVETDIQAATQAASEFAGEHNDLPGRAVDDAHPISAISALQSALDAKASVAAVASNTAAIGVNATAIGVNVTAIGVNATELADHESRITVLEADAVATFAQRIDDTTASTVYYFGEAAPGTLDAASVWRISRITFITPGEDDVDIEWADGDSSFDNVWDDRLILGYS